MLSLFRVMTSVFTHEFDIPAIKEKSVLPTVCFSFNNFYFCMMPLPPQCHSGSAPVTAKPASTKMEHVLSDIQCFPPRATGTLGGMPGGT